LALEFGPDRPGESHTTSLRNLMQYPALHRERFIAAAFAELSAPVELLEELLDGDVTRILIANPINTYRAHRPRSLGMAGIGRMGCYITASTAPHSTNTLYELAVANFIFATAADVEVHSSTHSSIDEAKRAASQYLRKRYREIPQEHLGIAASLLDGTLTEAVSLETAQRDLQRIGAVLVGTQKAAWLPELAAAWDGTLHKLISYVAECESKTQVLLLIGMLPDWSLSHKRLVQTVRALAPHGPDDEMAPGS
jgi:hypothetical protein